VCGREELEVQQQQYLEQLERYENSHMGNFRRIFPGPDSDKYDKYFHSSGTLFQETAAFRARSELARYVVEACFSFSRDKILQVLVGF
jgi:tubulin polyglutamylase TTLL6/13